MNDFNDPIEYAEHILKRHRNVNAAISYIIDTHGLGGAFWRDAIAHLRSKPVPAVAHLANAITRGETFTTEEDALDRAQALYDTQYAIGGAFNAESACYTEALRYEDM